MSSITGDLDEQTPLHSRLNKLTSSIGKVGLAVALVLVVILIHYFTATNDILNSVTHIFAAAVTIVVVAIPEGLPLVVTLTLAYSMKRINCFEVRQCTQSDVVSLLSMVSITKSENVNL
ncbi:calcium-transporting ATPase 12, plasma membrane-type-like protein [Tanacetum coccineum]